MARMMIFTWATVWGVFAGLRQAAGIVHTVAGTGRSGYSGDGGPATEARVGSPTALCFDGAGNLFFADAAFHVIRCLRPDGIIETLVGTSQPGFSPDGTLGRNAPIHTPRGVAVSAGGTLFFSEAGNHRVRYLARDGRLATLAGSHDGGDWGDDGPAAAAGLNAPYGLCLYRGDLLLISDHFNNRLRAVRLPAALR